MANNTVFKVDNLHLPPAPAQAPEIDFGPDFHARPLDAQNRYLKKLAAALNLAADQIQTERNQLLKDMGVLRQEAENQAALAEQRRETLHKAITAHNQEKQQMLSEIDGLQEELAKARVA